MSGGFGSFIGNLAEAALSGNNHSQHHQHQSDVSKTGGQEWNSPHNSGRSSSNEVPSFNHDEVVRTAQQHGSGESSLFSSAMGFLSDNKGAAHEPINEDDVTSAHQQVYKQGNSRGLSANALGGAAALQVLQKFTSGSGGSQSQLISMAMAEATKLFDQSGGSASGNKQDAVNGAAMTVMKMLVQSKLGPFTGGSNSGGLGGLLSLAQKFAK